MSIMYRDTTLTKIFVGGLPYHTTDESLQKFFDQFGPIEEAVVITDRHSGKSKGYGFVTMADRLGAEKACKDPNPIIDGRKANVNLAYLGAKPRLQAGEIFSLPLNLKTGLTAAYPAHISRIAPFIQPGAPAFIAAHPATLAPLTNMHPTSIPSNANAPIYPVSPGTPNGTPSPAGGLINYAPTAFAFPQIIHPGYETAPAYAPFSVIGYISSQPPTTVYNTQQQQQQQQQPSHHQQVVGAHSPTFVPALHCVPTQQILH